MEAQVVTIDQPFHSAYEKFIAITDHLSTEMAGDKTHSAIEAYLETAGRELLRLLLQDHLDNQGSGRIGEAVCGSDGVVRSHKRDQMETGYQSVFGAVRLALRVIGETASAQGIGHRVRLCLVDAMPDPDPHHRGAAAVRAVLEPIAHLVIGGYEQVHVGYLSHRPLLRCHG